MHPTLLCNRCRRLLMLQRSVYLPFSPYSSRTAALCGSQNYYQLLNVSRDAEAAEIKAAYIELSKMHHPDANPDGQSTHDDFVEINLAYEVLGKPSSRRDYDLTLGPDGRRTATAYTVHRSDAHSPFGAATHADSGWYRDFATPKNPAGSSGYYGFRGVKRVANVYIMYGCIAVVMVAGSIFFGFFKLRSSYVIKRLDAKDQKIAALYDEAKERRRKNGNKKQLEIMRRQHEEFREKTAARMKAQGLK